ncbi:MAG: hypothetical protein ACRDNB_01050 [Gaiellaceae bacterium]
MKKRTKLAAGAGAALAAAGAGGAIAATQLSPNEESKAVVEDAAKQLGVDPARLSDALKQALENRIDEAVEDGSLTKEQGEAMKQRLEADDFPLFGGPLLGHPHKGFGLHVFGDLDAAASYLGLSEAALREQLRDGKTLADVAKDEGKSVDGLVDALVAEATKSLDAAVADGRLTKAQRDKLAAHLEQRAADMVNGVRPSFPGLRPGFRFPGPGGPGGFRFREDEEEAPPPAA